MWRVIVKYAALVLLASQPVLASPQLVTIVYNSSDENPQSAGANRLAKDFQDRVRGRMVVDLLGGNMVGSENALVAAVKSGAADICVVTGAAVGPVVPEYGIYDVPFLFRDTSHAKIVSEGPVGQAIAAKFPQHGLVLLAVGEQGFRHLTNSKTAVRTPADLKGLRIRVLPNDIYKMTFDALGAQVVPMEFPLVYGALKEGRIDGQENPLPSIAGNHMYEVQKHISMTGHIYGTIAILMNRQSWEALDPADAAALAEAARAGAEATRKAVAESEARLVAMLKKEGMAMVEDVDRDAFRRALAPLEPELEKRFGKQLLNDIRAAR